MLPVDKKRVEELIAGLAKFGKTEAGITRLAYTSTDKAAQMWLLKELEYMNLEVREDVLGNLFLRRPGLDPNLPPVACGSHLDTVIHGGAYDGMCGVVGALEALHMLSGETLRRSVEVIVFRAEESSRFGFATIASKLITGKATPEKFANACRKDDITFKEAVKEWGGNLDEYVKAVLKPGAYKCFAEMHIEQGKVLEETGHQIGIVHNIAAPTRFKLHITGTADHSGATPMGYRKDALVSAAKMILAVETAAINEKENGTVGTVGIVDVDPGSINVVPGKVTLWVDTASDTVFSNSPGIILLSTNARMNADNVLITTILMALEPVFACTVVSTIILCEQSTITAKIVIARMSRCKVLMTAIAV